MMDVMYEIPSRDDVDKCVVTRATVVNREKPVLVMKSDKKTGIA